MAYEERLVNISATASVDLSTHQYRLVSLANQSGRTQAQKSVTLDRVIGVLQNDPKAGDTATIAIGGVSKLVAGGTITAGQSVMVEASGGRAIAYTGTTEHKVGVAQESAVAGQIFACLLLPLGVS
jgi:hypothetical protein